MSEPAAKKKQKLHAKEEKDRGGRTIVSVDPIDPSTNIFEAYTSWEEVPYELQCIVENAQGALSRGWIKGFEGAPLVVQHNKDFIRYCIIRTQWIHLFPNSHLLDDIDLDPTKDDELIKKLPVKLPVHEANWKDLPDEWKEDWEVTIAALTWYQATWQDIPESLRSQDDFIRKVALEVPDILREILPLLPDHIRIDKEFWLSDHVAYDHILYKQLLGIIPDLRESRRFWLKVVRSQDNSTQQDLFEQCASLTIRQDREIMMIGCMHHPVFYKFLPASFSHDEEFIRQVLQGVSNTKYRYRMKHLPKQSQRLFPHLVIEYMFPEYKECRNLTPYIDRTLWSNMDFAKAWLKERGRYLENYFPKSWTSNPDIFLWIAKECPTAHNLRSFQFASEELRSDKAFWLKALDLDPMLFKATPDELKNDLDLQMLVYSKISDKEKLAELGIKNTDGKQIREYVEEAMKAHAGLMAFLCCVAHTNPSHHPIALLNQGSTTSIAYYRSVTAYLGVPTGLKLECIRRCADNFCRLDSSN